jgi:hypothetical protein
MEKYNEIFIWVMGGITAFLGAIGAYLKKRLKELDALRKELTDLKVEAAVLRREKEIAKRAARNVIGSRNKKKYIEDEEELEN